MQQLSGKNADDMIDLARSTKCESSLILGGMNTIEQKRTNSWHEQHLGQTLKKEDHVPKTTTRVFSAQHKMAAPLSHKSSVGPWVASTLSSQDKKITNRSCCGFDLRVPTRAHTVDLTCFPTLSTSHMRTARPDSKSPNKKTEKFKRAKAVLQRRSTNGSFWLLPRSAEERFGEKPHPDSSSPVLLLNMCGISDWNTLVCGYGTKDFCEVSWKIVRETSDASVRIGAAQGGSKDVNGTVQNTRAQLRLKRMPAVSVPHCLLDGMCQFEMV